MYVNEWKKSTNIQQWNNQYSHFSEVKRKHEQTSRKDDAAGSLGRKETDMRFSFTNWTLASICGKIKYLGWKPQDQMHVNDKSKT